MLLNRGRRPHKISSRGFKVKRYKHPLRYKGHHSLVRHFEKGTKCWMLDVRSYNYTEQSNFKLAVKGPFHNS